MPKCFETVLFGAVNPGAGAAGVVAPGDPTVIRAFQQPAKAYLEQIIRMGATAGFVGVTSPMLHDPIRGIRITPLESPSVFSLPAEVSQSLISQDTLTVTISGGAAESDIAAISVYYTDLPGATARLYSWGDIGGNVKTIKPQAVAVVSSATPGQWVDTSMTTTENLLHANTDYAVLGYMSNAALGVIGIKGTDTSNFRAAGPGSTLELATTDYFVKMSNLTGRPHIPVFNSANAANTFVSVAASGVSVAATVELILAELVNPMP